MYLSTYLYIYMYNMRSYVHCIRHKQLHKPFVIPDQERTCLANICKYALQVFFYFSWIYSWSKEHGKGTMPEPQRKGIIRHLCALVDTCWYNMLSRLHQSLTSGYISYPTKNKSTSVLILRVGAKHESSDPTKPNQTLHSTHILHHTSCVQNSLSLHYTGW